MTSRSASAASAASVALAVAAFLSALSASASRASAYVEELYTLARVVAESTNIVLMKVERINKDRKLIIYTKVADLKGTHPQQAIKHNIGVGGFNQSEKDAPMEWAEPGKLAIFFHNGSASETCTGRWWYQCYPGGEWWNHSHGEPFFRRTFCGEVEQLKDAIEKLLKGEAVVVPAMVSKNDLRIQKVRVDPKDLKSLAVVEPPSIEKTPLTGVAGFAERIELPRPDGSMVAAIPADFDGDGYPDILLVGTGGLRLLINDRKGNFRDATEAWGLGKAPGAPAAAVADYDGSGRPGIVTAAGKLYTNLGDRFRDDSDRLPDTPKRVKNPGEALAWIDIDGDGRPDIVCSVGPKGLAAWRNRGAAGPDGKWFEDVSDRVGLGEKGLGTAAGNFLTAADLDGSGRTGFLLNLDEPLPVINAGGTFRAADARAAGMNWPARLRPAVAVADFRGDGRPGMLVTAARPSGALADWMMIGTFSADEEKAVAADHTFSPRSRGTVKVGDASWTWRKISADGNGVLAIRRADPVPNSAYAFTAFAWPASGKAVLHVGSGNALTVWINGEAKPVHTVPAARPFAPDADKIEVDLKEGVNTILLKVFDEGPAWRTCVRVLPPSAFPPPSVRLLAPAADSAPGKPRFEDVTADAGDLAQLRGECVSASWADLDGDGRPDLLVTARTGLVRVYLNQGGGKFKYATPELGLDQKFKAVGAAAADFGRRGVMDLLLVHADPAPPVVLVSRMKQQHAAVTVRFGAAPESPVGATVRALDSAGKVLATATISGGDGQSGQSAPEARFALPPGKYRLEARYSNGTVRVRDVELSDKPLWETFDAKTPALPAPPAGK